MFFSIYTYYAKEKLFDLFCLLPFLKRFRAFSIWVKGNKRVFLSPPSKKIGGIVVSSSQLIESPAIGNQSVQRYDTSRTLVVNRISVVAFTPTEYKLLLPLLSGQLIRDDDLINEAFGLSVKQWNRNNLSKYIDKLRCKLRSASLEVRRITKYGYVLVAL